MASPTRRPHSAASIRSPTFSSSSSLNVTPSWGDDKRDSRSLPKLQRFDVQSSRTLVTLEAAWQRKVDAYEELVERQQRTAEREQKEVALALGTHAAFQDRVRYSRAVLGTPLTRAQEKTGSLDETRRDAQLTMHMDNVRRETLARGRARAAKEAELATMRELGLVALRAEEETKLAAKAYQHGEERKEVVALEARRQASHEEHAHGAEAAAKRRAAQRERQCLRSPCKFRSEVKLQAFIGARRHQKEEADKDKEEAAKKAARKAEALARERELEKERGRASQRRLHAREQLARLERVKLTLEAAAARCAADYHAHCKRLELSSSGDEPVSAESDGSSYSRAALAQLKKRGEAAEARAAAAAANLSKMIELAKTPREERDRQRWHVTETGFAYYL